MAVFYTPNAEEVRAFIPDKLGFVHNEIGRGRLIFDVPEVDLGCPSLRQGLPFDLLYATTYTRPWKVSDRGLRILFRYH
jgi:hypothetical protein